MKPLQPHFDAHDVLAIQCEGEKEWTVSKVRLNCPLDVPALKPTSGARSRSVAPRRWPRP